MGFLNNNQFIIIKSHKLTILFEIIMYFNSKLLNIRHQLLPYYKILNKFNLLIIKS